MRKIINNLLKFKENLPLPEEKNFWLLVSFIIKLQFLLIYIYVSTGFQDGFLYKFTKTSNDTFSYINPIETLIETGNYDPDFRMPGYGWFYFILRLFFSKSVVFVLVPILQTILAAFSVYILAIISLKLLKSNLIFYITFFVYLLSFNVSYYDPYLLTESFTLSALIFSVYLFLNGEKNKISLIFSGFFLTWAIFMKPVLFPLLLVFFGFSLVKGLRYYQGKIMTLKLLLYFTTPFLIIESVWVIRNYMKHDKIFFLTKSIYVPEIEDNFYKSIFEFSRAIGISQTGWEPSSPRNFFHPEKKFRNPVPLKFSDEIFTSQFNMDSLQLVRNDIVLFLDTNPTTEQKLKLNDRIIERLDRYKESVKNEKPFLYHMKSRINTCILFFGHPGIYNLFGRATYELNKFEIVVKALYALLYIVVVGFGMIGLFYMFIFNLSKFNELFFLSSIGLYLALIHPLVLKMEEYRYILPAYPFLVIACVGFLYKLSNVFFRKNE